MSSTRFSARSHYPPSFSLTLEPRVAIKCDYFGAELLLTLSVLQRQRALVRSSMHPCSCVTNTNTLSNSMTSCKHEIFPILFAIVILLERYTIISHLNECMSPTVAINNKRTSTDRYKNRKINLLVELKTTALPEMC